MALKPLVERTRFVPACHDRDHEVNHMYPNVTQSRGAQTRLSDLKKRRNIKSQRYEHHQGTPSVDV